MSQKSSVPQAISFVSQVLKRDTGQSDLSADRTQKPRSVTSTVPTVTRHLRGFIAPHVLGS